MISDLVDYIQAAYPPKDRFPKLQGDRKDVQPHMLLEPDEGWPTNFAGIDRPPPPEWLIPGEGDSLDGDALLVLESQLSWKDGPPPANPDVLAYYLPFHFYRKWGIYIRASGVAAVASMLAKASGCSLHQCLTPAYQLLLQHERFHFYTEVACSRAEVAARFAIYASYFPDRIAAAFEEALANAHAFRVALKNQPRSMREATDGWMRSLGFGYRDFFQWVARELHSEGRRRLGSAMIMFGSGSGPPGPAAFLYDRLSRTECPTYLVRDIAAASILKPFPKLHGLRVLVHSNDHPPPHIHLETADRRPITRLQWPTLEPMKGDPYLSSSHRRNFDAYLDSFRSDIDLRVKQVYGVVSSRSDT